MYVEYAYPVEGRRRKEIRHFKLAHIVLVLQPRRSIRIGHEPNWHLRRIVAHLKMPLVET